MGVTSGDEYTTDTERAVIDFCGMFGLDVPPDQMTSSIVEQARVFAKCLAINAERNMRYKDLWTDYGWKGSLLHVGSKAARLRRIFWDRADVREDEDHDDAYDLINYTAFFVRLREDRNETG